MSRHLWIFLFLIWLAAQLRAAEQTTDTPSFSQNTAADEAASYYDYANSSFANPEFIVFWQQAFLQGQSLPVPLQRDNNEIIFFGLRMNSCRARCFIHPQAPLPPVMYLLDREQPQSYLPSATHSWLILDIRSIWNGEEDTGPEPSRHPLYHAILTAWRALLWLRPYAPLAPNKAGLVGEGRGGAVALALGALASSDVAFVAAHQPTGASALAQKKNLQGRYRHFAREIEAQWQYFSLPAFAELIRCPVLLSYGERDEIAPPTEIIAIYEKLRGPRKIVAFSGARHCHSQDLQQWQSIWSAWANQLFAFQ